MGTIRESIKKDGSRSYHAEVRLKGVVQRQSFRTKTDASDWVQRTEVKVKAGKLKEVKASGKITVADLINRYIETYLVRFPNRLIKERARALYWKESLGKTALQELTSRVIAEQRDKLLIGVLPNGKTRSSSTVNRYLAVISKACTLAVKEWGILEENPCLKVTKPPNCPGRQRFLSKDEIDRLLLECQRSKNKHLFLIVVLALETGMRKSEILGLRYKDLDFSRKSITLEKTKNGERRVLPLPPRSEELLSRSSTSNPKDLIFGAKKMRTKMGWTSIDTAFRTALRRAAIEEFRFHDLRHTAASYLAMAGATQGELQSILNHKSAQMT
ncbi:MAG: site-specific integrase, partial [Chlamydiota bacterium]